MIKGNVDIEMMQPALCFALVLLTAPGQAKVGSIDRGTEPSARAQQDQQSTREALSDGPYLFHQEDGGVTAKWVERGKVQSKRFAKGKPVELPRFANLIGESVKLERHKPPKSVWPLPERMLVISDVEGEFDVMERFLRGNGVVDKAGRWAFGKGHLVTVGDMVDRGTKQLEVLWMLWRLDREARKAGGRVHFVLGNHEVMQMGGDIRYTAPKYKKVAALFGIPCRELLGAETELGRWLRSCNGLVRVGPYLFVHAGISPEFASKPIDLDRANAAMRPLIGVPPNQIKSRTMRAVLWSSRGPFWYRGYFEEYAKKYPDSHGPRPTVEKIDKILANVGAKSIVVGHSKVTKITALFGKRRVLAIDIPWRKAKDVRGLLIKGKRVEVVDIQGQRKPLED